jgi:hypothetical protein
MKNGHDGGPPGSEPTSTPKPTASAAKNSPPTTRNGITQPPRLRPTRDLCDCGPGSRPGGRCGWSSSAAAIGDG